MPKVFLLQCTVFMLMALFWGMFQTASFGLDLSHICKRHYFTGEVISGNRALADLPAHLVQCVGGSFNERLEGPLSPGVEGTHAPK